MGPDDILTCRAPHWGALQSKRRPPSAAVWLKLCDSASLQWEAWALCSKDDCVLFKCDFLLRVIAQFGLLVQNRGVIVGKKQLIIRSTPSTVVMWGEVDGRGGTAFAINSAAN